MRRECSMRVGTLVQLVLVVDTDAPRMLNARRDTGATCAGRGYGCAANAQCASGHWCNLCWSWIRMRRECSMRVGTEVQLVLVVDTDAPRMLNARRDRGATCAGRGYGCAANAQCASG